MFIIFKIIDKTIGLRVPAEVEIDGLDIHEHGLTSAYAGFSISDANAAAWCPTRTPIWARMMPPGQAPCR